jgi:hypothetical protein
MNRLERFLCGISKSVYEEKENIFKTFCGELEKLDCDVSKTWEYALNNTISNLKPEDIEVLNMLRKDAWKN